LALIAFSTHCKTPFVDFYQPKQYKAQALNQRYRFGLRASWKRTKVVTTQAEW
jgi:hypothetical protein